MYVAPVRYPTLDGFLYQATQKPVSSVIQTVLQTGLNRRMVDPWSHFPYDKTGCNVVFILSDQLARYAGVRHTLWAVEKYNTNESGWITSRPLLSFKRLMLSLTSMQRCGIIMPDHVPM